MPRRACCIVHALPCQRRSSMGTGVAAPTPGALSPPRMGRIGGGSGIDRGGDSARHARKLTRRTPPRADRSVVVIGVVDGRFACAHTDPSSMRFSAARCAYYGGGNALCAPAPARQRHVHPFPYPRPGSAHPTAVPGLWQPTVSSGMALVVPLRITLAVPRCGRSRRVPHP